MKQLQQSSGNPVADKRADYAHGYASDKAFEAAADLMAQALELAPTWPAGWFLLGQYREDAGQKDAALDAYAQALKLAPQDIFGAGLKIAFLNKTVLTDAPLSYTESLFDDYAERFDDALVNRLGYVVPGLLAALLKSAPRQSFKTAIDLGCGTGLMATKVRAQINHLTGVDLSAAMLAKAQDKALYDVLQKADITAALNGATQYDLIMAADVFMYIPDLCPAFQAIAQSMTEDGLFLFSIEKQAGPHPWKLLESMRHAHAPSYIEHLLAQQNLTILRQQEATIRMDRGQPIAGVLFLAQRHGSTHAA